jgi:hypothetical protein
MHPTGHATLNPGRKEPQKHQWHPLAENSSKNKWVYTYYHGPKHKPDSAEFTA